MTTIIEYIFQLTPTQTCARFLIGLMHNRRALKFNVCPSSVEPLISSQAYQITEDDLRAPPSSRLRLKPIQPHTHEVSSKHSLFLASSHVALQCSSPGQLIPSNSIEFHHIPSHSVAHLVHRLCRGSRTDTRSSTAQHAHMLRAAPKVSSTQCNGFMPRQ